MEQRPDQAPDGVADRIAAVMPLRAIPVEASPAPEEREAIATTAVLAVVGAVAAGLEAVRIALLAAAGRTDEGRTDEVAPPALLPAMLGASAALVLASGRMLARAVDGTVRAAAFASDLALDAGPPALRRRVDGWRGRAFELDASWRGERTEAEEHARRVAAALVPQVVDTVLDQLDLTSVVLDRVDLDRIVSAVDLDEVLDRVDVQAIAEGLDLEAIAGRIDLNAVAAGIDVDAIAERLDVERIIRRLDLTAIATEVIDEIDLPEIIRESSGAVANETVREVRMRSIEADRLVERLVDRMIRRRDRSTGGPERTEDER